MKRLLSRVRPAASTRRAPGPSRCPVLPAAMVVLSLLGASLPADIACGHEPPPKRLLLLAQKPDGHPPATHEYAAGMRLLAKCLAATPQLKITVVSADDDWLGGPELISRADGVVLFLSQGAKWIHERPRRLEAFAQLAARGGGLATLHWGMGTREAEPVEGFLKLFGGCHGGPDRKFQVVQTRVHVVDPQHEILRGITDFDIREEFYYQLKFANRDRIEALLQADIDGQRETVAWAWQRGDGGRSFGFSGGHFHANWGRVEYQRLIGQGVLWTLKLPIPAQGLDARLTDEDLKLESSAGR